MRNPDGSFTVKGLTFVADKSYEYTWPGSKPTVVSAEEMATLIESSDPQLLNIKEHVERTTPAATPNALKSLTKD